MDGLTFTEVGHRYELDGREVPSVTTILAEAGLVDWSHCDSFARERGTLVHRAIHLELTTGLDWASVDEAFHPYISAALQSIQDLASETLEVERRVASRTAWYAGTLDRLCRMDNGKLALWDWKTGPSVPAYALQAAAYVDAYYEETGTLIPLRYGVQLKPDGTYALHPYTDRGDTAVFRAAAATVNWKRKVGIAA